MKYTLMFSLLLISLISCKKSSSEIERALDDLNTYSTPNSHGWANGAIAFASLEDAGECSISNGNVIYKKTDLSFSGTDYCYKIGEEPDFCLSSVQIYEINFSDEAPELKANMSTQCD